MPLPTAITIVEVAPRDGLQNEPPTLPVATRVEFIRLLASAGLRVIEAGSFTSAKWIPQLADSGEVLRALPKRRGVTYPVLVPNLRGLADAIAAGATEISVFAAATDAFSRHNINCDVAQSLDRFAAVISAALAAGLTVRGYVSCTLGCPYQGAVPAAAVARVATALYASGCREISLGDTIGAGTPRTARALFEQVGGDIPPPHLAAHFHDTGGRAIANLRAVLPLGIATIDAAAGGLGGCPYAPGAAGNVATEAVLDLLAELDIHSGVNRAKLNEATEYIRHQLAAATD